MIRRPVVAGLLLAAGCGRAPVLEDYSYARGYSGEDRLRAEVDYAAGRLHIGAARTGGLFEMHLRYDASRFRPIGETTPEGVIRLGTESTRRGGLRIGRGRALPQTAEIGFAPQAALDLSVLIGAAEAELDLGGLRLEQLDLRTGASRTRLRFGEPNPGTCSAVKVASGAGELRIEQAGNSGCPDWHFEGGVGKITVDLDGAWRGDPRMSLDLAVGGVVLEVPRGIGVRARMTGLISKFEGADFVRDGKTWTSAGFDQKARKVDVEVRSAVGGVRVEWR
jgi:hypothetical protein